MKIKYLLAAGLLVVASIGTAYVVVQGPAKSTTKQDVLDTTPQQLTARCGGELVNGAGRSEEAKLCYVNYFTKLLDVKGPKLAVDQLKSWALATNGLAGECHDVGHLLGKYAWKKLKMVSLEGDTTTCAFSYGHGILQQASGELTREEVIEKFSDLCTDSGDFQGCFHGLGHSLTDIKFNAVEADQTCGNQVDAIPSTRVDDRVYLWNLHFTCLEGWVMEQAFTDSKNWLTLPGPEGRGGETAMKVCGDLTGAGGAGCRGSALRNWATAPGIEVEGFTQLRDTRLVWFHKYCQTLSGDEERGCMQHLGLTTAEIWTLDMDNKIVAPHVEAMCTGEFYMNCLQSMLNSRWNRMGNSAAAVLPMCDLFKPENATVCRTALSQFGT